VVIEAAGKSLPSQAYREDKQGRPTGGDFEPRSSDLQISDCKNCVQLFHVIIFCKTGKSEFSGLGELRFSKIWQSRSHRIMHYLAGSGFQTKVWHISTVKQLSINKINQSTDRIFTLHV